MKNVKKGFVVPLIIILFAVIVVGGLFYLKNNKTSSELSNSATYVNNQYGFELKYSQSFKVADPCETTGGLVLHCVQFIDTKDNTRSVTVFVNSSTDLINSGWFSAADIRKKESKNFNGLAWDVLEMTIDKGNGAFGSNAALHVKNPYTYNVQTADKSLLLETLQTFKFTK